MNKYLGIDYAFHTHTYRCGHAFGTDEEFIKAGIKAGFKIIGFADHGMFLTIKEEDGGRNSNLFQDYIDSINSLKKKYAGTAEILLGGEFEYNKDFDWYYKELKEKYGYDYLICGQHSYIENNKLNYYFSKLNDQKALEHYRDDVIGAIESGHFAYIAHPDLFFNRFTKVTDEMIKVCEDIVKASIKYDVPLEVNMGGMRYNNIISAKHGGFPYPCDVFFKIAKELGAKIVVGIDAHIPEDFTRKGDFETISDFIKKCNLNIIKDFRIK